MEYYVKQGGLMRCCLETLSEAMASAEAPPKEGDILPCKYHPADNSMIFRDGVWQWNRPSNIFGD